MNSKPNVELIEKLLSEILSRLYGVKIRVTVTK